MTAKILIIEDDSSAARLIGYAFEHEGHEVLSASNGLQGMVMVREKRPDVIILDVMLPGLDGFEVCNRLKSDERTAHIPIVMLSAKGQDVDVETGKKVGADEYIVKPIDPDELLSRIEKFITKSKV